MLILDENQEVLTLLNSLDNDMQHPNSFIVGLALCCLGNIASPNWLEIYIPMLKPLLIRKCLFKEACIVAAKLVKGTRIGGIFHY